MNCAFEDSLLLFDLMKQHKHQGLEKVFFFLFLWKKSETIKKNNKIFIGSLAPSPPKVCLINNIPINFSTHFSTPSFVRDTSTTPDSTSK